MPQVETTGEQGRYNETAIKYAAKIHQARSASKVSGQPVVDDLFPSFNRAGLGVYREYERMGHQPVTHSFAGAGRSAGSDVRTPWAHHRNSAT